MKNINNILAISTLVLGVQITQADVTGVDHLHEDHAHRGLLFQTISASDRLIFRDENRNNMELMSTEERQTFIDNMNSGQGMDRSMGQGMGMDRSMGQGMGQGMGMNRGMGGGRR